MHSHVPVRYPFGHHISQSQRVDYGIGLIRETLYAKLEACHYKRVVVITGNTLSKTPSAIDPLIAAIGDRYVGTVVVPSQHGDLAATLALRKRVAATSPDSILSFGGGGIVEQGKVIACSVGRQLADAERFNSVYGRKQATEVVDVSPRRLQPLPHVAVPTTLSAGQHTASVAFIDADTQANRIYFHLDLLPDMVLLDPEVTIATPDALWASSGIKALDHAVEKYYGLPPHPIIDALALAAAPVIFRELPLSLERQSERCLQHRLNVLIASWQTLFGSIGYFKSGLSHVLGRQLGALCDVPHGITSCITLPSVVEFNCEAAEERLQTLAAQCTGGSAQRLGGDIRRLAESLGLPTRLRDVNVSMDRLPIVAQEAMKDPAAKTNPRPVTDIGEVERLLASMW